MRIFLLLAVPCLFAACSPKGQSAFMNPCSSMEAEVREKQALDARVKATEKQLREYRKQGDTASAASASQRLTLMQENQRLLKESLEQSSRDCSPTMQDPVPVRDPASRDISPPAR
jgi:hypothetical protein